MSRLGQGLGHLGFYRRLIRIVWASNPEYRAFVGILYLASRSSSFCAAASAAPTT